jgi:signal transduction histidine kinase
MAALVSILFGGQDKANAEKVEEICGRCLIGCGIVVEPAPDLPALLEKASNTDYDIILIDPRISPDGGFDALSRIRNINYGSAVVLLEPLDAEQGLRAVKNGSTDYIPKGQNLEQVLTRCCLYTLVRKIGEDELKAAIETKSHLLSTVAHELRTSLACMKNAVSIIASGAAGAVSREQDNLLDIANRNIDRLTRLVNSVLDLQSIRAAKTRLNVQPQDVAGIIEEVRRMMWPSAKQKGLELVAELEDDIPPATVDRDKIIQVLVNLLNNAIKFTPSGGRINVTAGLHEDNLLIQVSDTGIGIPKESLPKIFDVFYRIPDNSTNRSGSGLGLTIAHEIVTAHHGKIEVESKVKRGTRFLISIPIKGPQQPAQLNEQTDSLIESLLCGK